MASTSSSSQGGIETFLESLNAYNADEILTNATQEQIMGDIAVLPAEHKRQAANAFINALKDASVGLDRRIVQLCQLKEDDETAQKAAGPAIVRSFYPMSHAYQRITLSQPEKHVENLERIERQWGKKSASRYRAMGKGLSQSASQHIATMSSSKIKEFVAVAYLNAEILARIETNGHVKTNITNTDAKVAKEKVVNVLKTVPEGAVPPLPVLDPSLLEKHGLRISSTSGLLKPKTEPESDEDVDENETANENVIDETTVDKDENEVDEDENKADKEENEVDKEENKVDKEEVNENEVNETTVDENMASENPVNQKTSIDKDFNVDEVLDEILAQVLAENMTDDERKGEDENVDESGIDENQREAEHTHELRDQVQEAQRITGREGFDTPGFRARLEAWLVQDLEDETLARIVVSFVWANVGWILNASS